MASHRVGSTYRSLVALAGSLSVNSGQALCELQRRKHIDEHVRGSPRLPPLHEVARMLVNMSRNIGTGDSPVARETIYSQ